MSAADDAYREWSTHPRFNTWVSVENAFIEGYRRALEDAADEIHANGDSWAVTENVKPDVRDVVSNVLWGTADYVRARAADVAPRETKD